MASILSRPKWLKPNHTTKQVFFADDFIYENTIAQLCKEEHFMLLGHEYKLHSS